jgi:hypothetical protein
MSKLDEKYIDALKSFTDALEQIVETLKSQQKSGKSDTVNDMLKNMPTGNINKVIKDLKKTTEKGFKDVKDDNQKILKKIEGIRQQKESGSFEKIEDPKNKKKIVDGIKVVILIAAGVLALGMAFKIIGKVDFLSVVALSTAMLAMSIAFSKVADIKNLTYSKIFKIALILPIMAAGLALSAWFLRGAPSFSLMQGLSIAIVAGALGIATFLISKALSNINSKSLIMIPLIPILLPLIALGIVKSSIILKDIQQLTLMQVLSVALVGLAIGVATIGIAIALRFMKKISWKEMLALPIMIPLIAMSIVMASSILKDFEPIRNPLQLLLGSFVIGLSLLAFAPTIWILGKMGISQLIKGAIGVLLVAGSILGVAWIFSFLPDNMKYPGFMWTLGTGLSLLLFGVAAVAVGLLASLVTPLVFGIGLLSLLAVAGSMVGVSLILNEGVYDKYPPLAWALGVGGSLILFSIAAIAASVAGLASAIGSLFTGGEDPLARMARSMTEVSFALQGGKWDGNYPKYEWALGVGTALTLFAGATVIAAGSDLATAITGFFTGNKDPLKTLAQSMVNVSKIVQGGKWSGNYPKYEWSIGVGTAMVLFAGVTVLAGTANLASSILGFFSGKKDPLMALAQSMVDVSKKLQEGNWGENYPKMEWAINVAAIMGVFSAITVLAGATKLASSILTFFSSEKDPLVELAKSISTISIIFNLSKFDKYPSKEWSISTRVALVEIAKVTQTLKDFGDVDLGSINKFAISMRILIPILNTMEFNPNRSPISEDFNRNFSKFLINLKSLPDKSKEIRNLAASFRDLSTSLKDVKSFDNLSKIASGVIILTAVDDNKLQVVLDKIKANEDTFKTIYGDNSSITGMIKNVLNTGVDAIAAVAEKSKAPPPLKIELYPEQQQSYRDLSEIKFLLAQLVENSDKPAQAGSFHK